MPLGCRRTPLHLTSRPSQNRKRDTDQGEQSPCHLDRAQRFSKDDRRDNDSRNGLQVQVWHRLSGPQPVHGSSPEGHRHDESGGCRVDEPTPRFPRDAAPPYVVGRIKQSERRTQQSRDPQGTSGCLPRSNGADDGTNREAVPNPRCRRTERQEVTNGMRPFEAARRSPDHETNAYKARKQGPPTDGH